MPKQGSTPSNSNDFREVPPPPAFGSAPSPKTKMFESTNKLIPSQLRVTANSKKPQELPGSLTLQSPPSLAIRMEKQTDRNLKYLKKASSVLSKSMPSISSSSASSNNSTSSYTVSKKIARQRREASLGKEDYRVTEKTYEDDTQTAIKAARKKVIKDAPKNLNTSVASQRQRTRRKSSNQFKVLALEQEKHPLSSSSSSLTLMPAQKISKMLSKPATPALKSTSVPDMTLVSHKLPDSQNIQLARSERFTSSMSSSISSKSLSKGPNGTTLRTTETPLEPIELSSKEKTSQDKRYTTGLTPEQEKYFARIRDTGAKRHERELHIYEDLGGDSLTKQLGQEFHDEQQKRFDAELEKLRNELNSKHEQDSQFLKDNLQRMETSYSIQVEHAKQLAQIKAEQQLYNNVSKIEHILDVNTVARTFLSEMETREEAMKLSIKAAKRNECRYIAQLRDCVSLQEAKEFICRAISKGRSLQMFLGVTAGAQNLHYALTQWRWYAINSGLKIASPSLCAAWKPGGYGKVQQIRKSLNDIKNWRLQCQELGACSVIHIMMLSITKRCFAAFYKVKMHATISNHEMINLLKIASIRRETVSLWSLAHAVRCIKMRKKWSAFVKLLKMSLKSKYAATLCSSKLEMMKPTFSSKLQPKHVLSSLLVAKRHIKTPWEVPYYQHRYPNLERDRLRQSMPLNAEFIPINTNRRDSSPQSKRSSEPPIEFLREQFSVGMPLCSTKERQTDQPQTALDYRNMPLGSLGTAGMGYVKKKQHTSSKQQPNQNG